MISLFLIADLTIINIVLLNFHIIKYYIKYVQAINEYHFQFYSRTKVNAVLKLFINHLNFKSF